MTITVYGRWHRFRSDLVVKIANLMHVPIIIDPSFFRVKRALRKE